MGVWTGELPEFLRMSVENDSNSKDMPATSLAENIDAEIKTSAQDIASYQVIHICNLNLFQDFSGSSPTEI